MFAFIVAVALRVGVAGCRGGRWALSARGMGPHGTAPKPHGTA